MLYGPRLRLAVVALAACSDTTAPLATAEPGIVFTYPVDAQLDVPLGANVVVAFSDKVESTALGACTGAGAGVSGAFCVVGPDGPIAAMPEVASDGKSVQLSGVTFAPGTTYDVYVRPALAPGAKNLPASGPLLSFTTRSAQPRSAAPALVAINGAPPSSPESFRPMLETTTIRLVFSEPLDPRTVTLAGGALELIDTTTSTPVPARVLASGIHVSIDPIADLVPGRAYQLNVGDQLADLGGQHVAAMAIPLSPRGSGADHPIPQVLRTRRPGDPGPQESRAGIERNVISMDKPLIGKESLPVLPSVLAAELGDPRALDGPIAFTIRRGQRLRATGLAVKLGGELDVGLATGEVEIELLTDGSGRIYRNPYQPASQRPENLRAPLFVDLSLDVAVYAVDPAGNAVLTQTVLGVQAIGTAVATDGLLDIETVIAMDLDLLGVARAPTNLVLDLITDPAAQVEADRTAPSLVATMPGGAEAELPVDAGIELIFSEPIDLDRARDGGVRLETAAGQAVASVLESHGASLVIRPVAPLAYSTSYRVVLAGVADIAGNALASTAPMSFTTGPLVGTSIPLAVSAVHPGVPCTLGGAAANTPGRCTSGGGQDDMYHPFTLAADQPIEVRFTQPPAPASLGLGTACNAGSVRVEEVDGAGACVAAVAGTLIHHDRALSFVPDAPWQDGKHYRLTLVSGTNASCTAGEICGISGNAASFDPLGGDTSGDAGGPNLVIDYTGAAPTGATLVVTEAGPYTDLNGSGFVETGEIRRDDNRVLMKITDTGGLITSAKFDGNTPDCDPSTSAKEACLYLSGAMPVELMPLSHDCALPRGETAASCVPVVLSPQAMYGTSIAITATALLVAPVTVPTGVSVLRIREPASGPVTGYLIDDQGTPTLVLELLVYLDAPDMSVLGGLASDDLHSKQISVVLRGPLRFLPDGRIAIAVKNTDAVALSVSIDAIILSGSVSLQIPAGEMKIQLVSPPLRGGLR